MLEVFSTNIALTDGLSIPFNNVIIEKGCTAVLEAPATIDLNKCGVYMVSCDASVTGTAAGDVSIQMYKNGVAQPQAISTETVAAAETAALGFTTLVQVRENNTCACFSSPTALQFVYDGEDATGHINVCVTKVC